jgi:hypothetical protein
LTRLAVLVAALAWAAAAPLAETCLSDAGRADPRSAADRHWLAYTEMQRRQAQ